MADLAWTEYAGLALTAAGAAVTATAAVVRSNNARHKAQQDEINALRARGLGGVAG